MTESLMTDQAATTTEGTASSQASNDTAATAEALYGEQQQATEGQDQQAQDSAPADNAEGDQGEAEASAEGAPEKYEFQAPEGKEYASEVIADFSEIAKELNLTQEAAQKLLDKMAPSIEARNAQQIESIRSEWANQAQTDKEFGGDKLNENLAIAKKALDNFGTPELRTLLNESGLGNNPEVIRFMFRAGKAISEDTYVGNTSGTSTKAGPADFNSKAAALYTNQQS